ncbi:MAG: leucine--tRNA ligase [Candidatus Pacearchaeota archaeon]|nr:leucine--tRNA ligase [Candidatus Pacearchaeota archaeon]
MNKINKFNLSKEKVVDFAKIEKKWQELWEKKKAFVVKEGKKRKCYVLEMFPYPSASGLHVGHAFNYIIGDIYARFKRMQGFNVLYPMGYDAFGLPAENAAIKAGEHPKKYTENAINNFVMQQKRLGLSYDWGRMIKTCDADYYKWNQYFFLKFFKKGLVYRKKSSVNWCPKCKSVLANEQVHNGKCWRHDDVDVEIKSLEQWFFRISNYAEELLQDVQKLDWPERIKIMQENWIGKSEGTEIFFEINSEKWAVFTTRPDTLFGVTFLVISAQHPRLMEIVKEENKKEVEEFLRKIKSTSEKDNINLEKEGVFSGSYAIHPLTKEKIPIWIGNFVVADYGSGMVMAVPAHDQRDFEFAKKYNLPIKLVVVPLDEKLSSNTLKEAYLGNGVMINSEEFNDLENVEAMEHITKALEMKKLGKKTVNYKLRDWLISRQRYWGTPIPIIYCEKCGIVPEKEDNLPIVLPEKVKFGEGNPLSTNEEFVNTKCPKCGRKAKRETDTMDTFVDSSWYFLRFCDSANSKVPFDKKKVDYWMPVDQYIGGAEHACMHLIYARFFCKALRDFGFVSVSEPFKRLFNQGMIHGEDGFVMSKSRGNVVNPSDMINKYSADSLRLFLVSMASPDKDTQWSTNGIESMHKFVTKIFEHCKKIKFGKSSKRFESKINKTIKELTNEIENFRYNIAIIKLRELFSEMEREEEIAKSDFGSFIKMLSLFCPHIAEELWCRIGSKNFVSLADWPVCDEKKIDEKFEEMDKNFEKAIEDINNILKIMKEKGKEIEKVYLYVLPKEIEGYNEKELAKRIGKEIKVFAVNDKKKYDPENKSGKAKPGKPGIYVE